MQFNQHIAPASTLSMGDVKIGLVDERIRYSLRLKKEDLAKAKKITGWEIPAQVGASFITDKIMIVCLGPDEWMIIAQTDQTESIVTKLRQLDESITASIAEVSHRNMAFIIEGNDAARLLSVGCPLDVSLSAFPVGKVTRTIFENAQIMIIRTQDHVFHVESWRSFAPYLWTFFRTVSTDFDVSMAS